jgi:hypothetical protein
VVLEALWNLPMSASSSEGKWAPRCMCPACRLSIMFAVYSMSFLAWQCLTTLMLRQDYFKYLQIVWLVAGLPNFSWPSLLARADL